MKRESGKKILITGAGGFVGQQAVGYFLDHGWSVCALVRDKTKIKIKNSKLKIIIGDVRSRATLNKATKNVWGVVHLAVAKADEKESYTINVEGAKNLIAACHANRVARLINVSTGATYLPRRGIYGTTKREADLLFAQLPGAVTLIPGLIYGDYPDGAFGALVKAAGSPIVPLFGSGETVFQPVHRDDVVKAIDYLLTHPNLTGCYDLPGPQAFDFHSIIHFLAHHVHGKNKQPLFIHIPASLGLMGAAFLARIMKKPPFTRSNILGSTQKVILKQTLPIKPRALKEGVKRLRHNLHMKSFEREGEALLRYVLSPAAALPDEGTITRYVHVIMSNKELSCHHLSPLFKRWPVLISPLDALAALLWPQGRLKKKILIAAMLAECSPASAQWLLPKEMSHFRLIGRVIIITLRLVITYIITFFFLVAYPVTKRYAR